ncbi:hypothetical protein JHK86_033941 [Glycine max]|nr:hypothetical protein JHK86_033941 [Glycine max]
MSGLKVHLTSSCSSSGYSWRPTPNFLIYVLVWNNGFTLIVFQLSVIKLGMRILITDAVMRILQFLCNALEVE